MEPPAADVSSNGDVRPANGDVRPANGDGSANGDVRSATVRSVVHALKLLEILSDAPTSGHPLSDLARMAGMSKSATFATLQTLTSLGYVRVAGPRPRYKLGMKLVRLGDVAARSLRLTELCAGLLRELADASGLTVRLAIADDGYPFFVDRVDGPGAIRFHTPLGGRELPHTTAAGKAILATLPSSRIEAIVEEAGLLPRTAKSIDSLERLYLELEKVRSLGYAIDDEEGADGVVCIGAVILDYSGAAAGAFSMTGLKFDTQEHFAELGKLVMGYAARASQLVSGGSY